MDAKIKIKFNLKKETFDVWTNIKDKFIADTVLEFLRSVMGTGKDKSKAKKLNIYLIEIGLALEGDIFTVKSNTGNKGLREGILMLFVKKMDEDRNNITIHDSEPVFEL